MVTGQELRLWLYILHHTSNTSGLRWIHQSQQPLEVNSGDSTETNGLVVTKSIAIVLTRRLD
jgi:hypothetical protein